MREREKTIYCNNTSKLLSLQECVSILKEMYLYLSNELQNKMNETRYDMTKRKKKPKLNINFSFLASIYVSWFEKFVLSFKYD